MPPTFDPSFAPPHWAWWITLYFFFGGITGGVYFASAWLDLFGDAADREAVRLGHLLAFPLILVCTAFLVVDLGHPERFWHMLFESTRFPLPILKPYSPMSLGSVILAVFGLVAFISFVEAIATRGRERLFHGPGNPLGRIVSIVGAIAGLALAGYTGALVNVSNEPVWSTSPLISALFVFSGMSTGIATILLFARRASHATRAKLEEADNYMMALELVTLIAFLATLGAVGARYVVASPVLILFLVAIVVGLLVPLVLHLRPSLAGSARAASPAAAVLALVGGFVLRWAILAGPQGVGL